MPHQQRSRKALSELLAIGSQLALRKIFLHQIAGEIGDAVPCQHRRYDDTEIIIGQDLVKLIQRASHAGELVLQDQPRTATGGADIEVTSQQLFNPAACTGQSELWRTDKQHLVIR